MYSQFLILNSQLLLSVVIFASLSIILSPSAQGPLVQAELGSAFAYRKNFSLLIPHSPFLITSISIIPKQYGAISYGLNV